MLHNPRDDIDQAIYRAFSTACKLSVARLFETVFLNFRAVTSLLRVIQFWL